MATILVTGGRRYFEETRVFQILDAAVERLGMTLLIHGDNPDGADNIAKQWAIDRGFPKRDFPAKWDDLTQPGADIRHHPKTGKPYDRRAGSRRNQHMLEQGRPDVVIAFPGNVGTRDMIRRARSAGVRVILVDWDG